MVRRFGVGVIALCLVAMPGRAGEPLEGPRGAAEILAQADFAQADLDTEPVGGILGGRQPRIGSMTPLIVGVSVLAAGYLVAASWGVRSLAFTTCATCQTYGASLLVPVAGPWLGPWLTRYGNLSIGGQITLAASAAVQLAGLVVTVIGLLVYVPTAVRPPQTVSPSISVAIAPSTGGAVAALSGTF